MAKCEVDETFIGGKARNMHMDDRKRRITGTGGKDKTAVMGILERARMGRRARFAPRSSPNRKKKALQAEVRKHVEAGAALYTDALHSYEGLDRNSSIRLWTMQWSTLTVKFTRTGWRTSGAC